jgi:hypothetical protein
MVVRVYSIAIHPGMTSMVAKQFAAGGVCGIISSHSATCSSNFGLSEWVSMEEASIDKTANFHEADHIAIQDGSSSQTRTSLRIRFLANHTNPHDSTPR